MSPQDAFAPACQRFVRSRAALWTVALLLVLALGGGLSARSAHAASSPSPSFSHSQVTSPAAVVPVPSTVPQTATLPDQIGGFDPCLNVVKSVDKTTANIGDTVTYTLKVTNNVVPPGIGAFFPTCVDAINPSITDQEDVNVEFVDFGSGGGTVSPPSAFNCADLNHGMTCSSGIFHVGDTATITFKAVITGCGSTSNYATFTAANAIFMIPPFFFSQTGRSNGVVTTINCPELSLTKTLAPDTNVPAIIGGTVHYTIVVKNQGSAPARGVTITDVVPAGYSFASASIGAATPSGNAFTACSYTSGTRTVSCGGASPAPPSTLNVLNAGDSVTEQLYLTVVDCQLGPNTATVTSSTPESDFNGVSDTNNTATAPAPAVKCPNLTVSKTASAATVPSGGTVSYSITVQNTGNAAVQPTSAVEPPIKVTDTLPANVQVVSLPAGTGWSCSGVTVGEFDGTFTCTWVGNGAGGAGGLDINQTTAPITLTVRVPSLNPGQANLTICNMAAVNGAVITGPDADNDAVPVTLANGQVVSFDPNDPPVPETSYQDNVSQACVTVTPPNAAPEPNPAISKSADKTSAATGDFVTFTITVSNIPLPGTTGQDMTNVVVTDQLPASVSLQNPPGFTVSPAGTGFVCTISPTNLITCSGGTVKSGQTVTISFVVEVNQCPSFTNTATLQSYTDADDDAQDADDVPLTSNKVTITVTNCPSLTIHKDGPATVPNTQALVPYTVTVKNTGAGAATGVVLTDTIGPANEISMFFAITPSQGTCSAPVPSGPNDVITCQLGNLAPGGQATLNLMVLLSGGSFCSLTNTATAYGFLNGVRSDAVPVDAAGTPSATGATVTTTTPCPSVSIAKRFDHSDSNNTTAIVPDTHAIWVITVTNSSPTVQALGVVVTDTIDHPENIATLAATSTQGSCVPATQTPPGPPPQVTCSIGTMAPGAVVTITVDALIKSAPPACTMSDTATVTTTNGNLGSPTSAKAGPTPVLCSSLTVTKTVTAVNGQAPLTQGPPPGVPTAQPGDTVTYEIDVKNPSVSTLSSVTVTDSAPSGLHFVAGSGTPGGGFSGLSCVTTTTSLNCTGGTLAGGTTGTVTVQATVDRTSDSCHTITNTATASGTNTFGQTVTASGKTDLLVVCPLVQVKKALADGNGVVITPPTAQAGTNAPYHYLITVVNNGNQSTPVELRDTLPADEDVNCPSLPIGSCLPGPFSQTSPFGSWSCTVTGVPPAQETVDCKLSGALPQGGVVVLDIPVSFGGPSRTDTNCADFIPAPGEVLAPGSVTRGCVTVEVFSSNFHPTVTITKQCGTPLSSTPTVNFGDTLTCVLTVKNTGNAPAEQVAVTDTTPKGLTFTPSPTNPASAGGTTPLNCSASTASQVNCSGGKLASQGNPGDTATITVTYTVSGCGSITNTATVTFQTGPAAGSSSSATITSQCAALQVTKTAVREDTGATETVIDTSHGFADAENPFTPGTADYHVTVKNTGTGHTVGLKVTDPIPSGGTIEEIVDTGGMNCSASTSTMLSCTSTTDLAPNASVTIIFEVDYAFPGGCGSQAATPPTNTVTNKATATDASGATNSGSYTVTVYCADLAVADGGGSSSGSSGFGTFTKFIKVTNTGIDAAATNVTLHIDVTETTGLSGTLTSVTATNGGTCTFSSTATTMTADCTWTSIPKGQMNAVTLSGFFTGTGGTFSYDAKITKVDNAQIDTTSPDLNGKTDDEFKGTQTVSAP